MKLNNLTEGEYDELSDTDEFGGVVPATSKDIAAAFEKLCVRASQPAPPEVKEMFRGRGDGWYEGMTADVDDSHYLHTEMNKTILMVQLIQYDNGDTVVYEQVPEYFDYREAAAASQRARRAG